MRVVTILRLLPAIAVLLVATAAFPQGHAHDQHHDKAAAEQGPHGIAPPGPDASPFEKEMYKAMVEMMVNMHSPGYTGNWDIDFLAMMIPHHQGAIDMARLVLMYGEDPLTRSLASEIIASQQAEIDAMKARLAILREKGRDSSPGEYPSLTGTRGSGK